MIRSARLAYKGVPAFHLLLRLSIASKGDQGKGNVSMSTKELHYYTSGYTAKGHRSLLASNLEGMEHVYILEGGRRTQRTALLREAAERQVQAGITVEYLHNPIGEDALDGLVIPALRTAVVQAEALEGPLPDAVTMQCGARQEPTEMQKLDAVIQAGLDAATKAFKEGLAIHDDWEALYIARMDRAAHRAATEQLIEDLLGERRLEKPAVARHRFMGAATPLGSRDFITNLTEGLTRRIFLKGRPGTGKSTLLKALAAQAADKGLDTEVYHCGFDPDSLDMIILRELDVAVIDTTAPHEYFPDRAGDEIFDLYEKIIPAGTDEELAGKLADIATAYRAKVALGTACLARVQQIQDAYAAAGAPPDAEKQEAARQALLDALDRLHAV